MNWDDEQESVFEQALRADLPTLAQQNRMRQRILAAGVAAGTALGSTTVAAATQASFGASALSKLSALSWPAKIGLTAALAAPVAGVALPLLHTPARTATSVGQASPSAAPPRVQPARKVNLPTPTRALEAPPSAQPELADEPLTVNPVSPAPRTPEIFAKNALKPAAVSPSAALSAGPSPSTAESAVVAFDSLAHSAPVSEADGQRNASTLSAETQVLDRAFAALAANDRATAAALVAEHARRFPNGLLRQERERARARLTQDLKGE